MQSTLAWPFVALAAGAWALARHRKSPNEAPDHAQTGGQGLEHADVPGEFPLALTPEPDAVVITEKARFQHLEILGSSGTGKNYHGLLPMIAQDIARGAGVIVLDPKGAMRANITAYAKAAQRGKDLRCLDLSDPLSSDSYNPFVGDDAGLVAERTHAALYADDATPTAFYRDTALGFLYAFFGLCRRIEALPTPAQLRELAMDPGLLSAFTALAPRSPEARDLKRQFLRLTPADYARNLQGLVNALNPLTTGPFSGLLNTVSPSIALADLLDRGGILYAGLASDQYPSAFKRVSTLLLMDLQASLTRRYGKAAPAVFLYLDEFAELMFPQIRTLVTKAREARVGITLAHQSLGDLSRHGRAAADAIFENTSNKVILRIGGADSAELLARLSGTKTPDGERVHAVVNRGGLRGERSGRNTGEGRGKEPLFHPNDLLNLGVGEAFMIVQNSGGRGLYRGLLSRAPDLGPPPRGRGKARKPAPGRDFRPLELAAQENAGRSRGLPEPSTPLGEAALQRMQRKRRREP